MDCFSTLRTRTFLFAIGMFFSFSLAGQSRIQGISGNNQRNCVGETILISISIGGNENISGFSTVDNDPLDGIIGVGFCSSCGNGGSAAFFLSVNIGSGVPGSTGDFTITLNDPNGFIDFTGEGTFSGPNQIEFTLGVIVDDVPIVQIIPSSLEICDGGTGNLTALITNGTSIDDYDWSADGGFGSFSTGNPGNSAIAIAQDADTYHVVATNQCGDDDASAIVTNNLTPSIQLDCTHNGDATTTITADILNAATGVNVQFFNNGNPHSSSNNNDGPGDDPSITVSDATFDQQVFTATANNSCGNASISGSCLVLPVELLYFRGEPLDRSISLNWATATELNNDYFTVERSLDGRKFNPIGIIPGAGNSQEVKRYHFVDESVTRIAVEKNIYYRLRQTDFDGHFTLSEIIVLEIDPRNFFDILEHSFQAEYLKLTIHNPQYSPLDVHLYDLNGRLIREIGLPATEGRTELSLATNELQAGFYIVTVSNGQQRMSKRVAKVE